MSRVTAIFAAFSLLTLNVYAHMGLTPAEAIAGERTIVTLRIGHDCGDDTIGTTNFTVVLPPRLASVTVEQLADWRIYINKTVADPPIDTGHGLAEEYVSSITYMGFLPDGFYQLFNIRIKMPDTPGEMLWFKGYQDCHNQGTSLAWEQIPTEENPKPRYPARSVTILPVPTEEPEV